MEYLQKSRKIGEWDGISELEQSEKRLSASAAAVCSHATSRFSFPLFFPFELGPPEVGGACFASVCVSYQQKMMERFPGWRKARIGKAFVKGSGFKGLSDAL